MARVAIVSYDVQTIRGKAGGVGVFTTRWANLLREAGNEVTIVMTRVDWEPMSVDVSWRARYQADGISLVELQAPRPVATRWPEVPTMRISEMAAAILNGFDVVYFQDWGNPGFHLLRERRFSQGHGPVCVTVLHGPSEWELSSNEKYPELPGDLHLAYQERYAARHSDFVVSPSNYMAEHLRGLGWEFPTGVKVLGLPMPVPAEPASTGSPSLIRTIIYFGRIEERKGIRIFVQALRRLAKLTSERPAVVLLGSTMDSQLLEVALREIKGEGFAVTHLADMDSGAAIEYLRVHAAHSLCVVPSRADNHPYSVVEASLVPGLNLIACRGGGVPEILDNADGQLCEPYPDDLAAKIKERLDHPLSASQLARYDFAAANEGWLRFHEQALAWGEARKPRPLPPAKRSVDVCVTYFQKAPYLGQLVNALEHQTEQDFHVIAVNDGSPDEESQRVFNEFAGKTSSRGWDFFSQQNTFVDAARNHAAARGKGEFILFIDSDDVPAMNAVARLREALERSGDDALICASYLFASETAPFDTATGETRVSAYATCIPLGIDLVGGLLNPSAFGGSMFMIRRSVFEAIGGYREVRGAGHEDWELYVRLVLAGYKVDILPEMLQFYRQLEGSLARTLSADSAKRRLLHPYEVTLKNVGLQGGALALAGLYESRKEMEISIKRLQAKVDAPKGGYAFFSGARGRFEADGTGLSRIQSWYRAHVSLETRLKIHRTFLARFVGPYESPPA